MIRRHKADEVFNFHQFIEIGDFFDFLPEQSKKRKSEEDNRNDNSRIKEDLVNTAFSTINIGRTAKNTR